MAMGDAFALTLSLLLGGGIRNWLLGTSFVPEWSWLLIVGWLAVASAVRLLPSWGLGIVEELRRVVTMLLLTFAATAVVLFLTKQATETSRLTLTLSFLISLALVPYVRTWVKVLLINRKLWGLPTVIYGDLDTGSRVIEALREERGLGYIPIGLFEDNEVMWGDYVDGVPVLGGTDQSTHLAPVAILAMPDLPREGLVSMLEGPLSRYKKVVLVPDLFEMPSLWVRSRNLAGIVALEITSALLDPLAQFFKRVADIFAVCLLLPLWGPLYVLIAAAIWLEDRKNPFFLQKRIGLEGEAFFVRKFRTMVTNAEEVLQQHLATDPLLKAEWEANFKLRNDPRITRVGKMLRRTSLDEIPQLVNVLRGEMSLVGPRPLPAYHHAELPERVQRLRLRVRPGITGLWQVSGRSDAGNEGFIRWDAYYVRNWSIWLDVVILVRTIRVVIRGSGAY